MTPERIVFSSTLSPEAESYLREQFPSSHELRVRTARGVTDDDLAWATGICVNNIPADKIRAQDNIGWLHVPAVGIDPFLSLRETRPDLHITRHGPFNARAVAEHGLGLLLALRREIPAMVEAKPRRIWARDPIFKRHPPLVAGSQIHVLGFGPVAQTVITLLAAVGAEITVYRRSAEGNHPGVKHFRALHDLATHIGGADALISVLPGHPEIKHRINATVLDSMQPSSVLVNLGRSDVLDHEALVAALTADRLAGAALDVFDQEPLPPESPLWSAPNLIISPHVGGQFRGNLHRGIDIFLGEFEQWLAQRG
ncbi:MAG: hypothetical protein H7A44_08280 [Opitutaceae bacterium]|nr:hypothetical protein [Cephaloticoccus sp.]MCP5530427.1 hypothetical protein [Opitutaceae bacterium]